MKFKRRARQPSEVNLTPLIDVVFLLLIFFMVTTTFTREQLLSLQLPEADSSEEKTVQKNIEIVVSSNGGYSINGQNVVAQDRKTLAAAISKTSGGETSKPLIITADANASHQSVVTVMDVAGKLGFSRISMTTRQVQE